MKKVFIKIKDICILMLLAVTIFMVFPYYKVIGGSLSEGPDKFLKVKNYRFTEDVTLKGVFGGYVFSFDVDEEVNVINSYLDFTFTQSQLLQKGYSTATFYLNDEPVYTLRMDSKDTSKENVKIPMTSANIIKGFNQLRIQLYRRISHKPCTDDVNYGNWFIINRESFLHIDFTVKVAANDLSKFPYPFISAGNEFVLGGIIAIPDQFTKDELYAAINLSSVIGGYRKLEDINVGLLKLSDIKDKGMGDILFIGNSEDTPLEILNNLNQTEKDSAERSAVIKMMNSPYNNERKLLAIIGNSSGAMLKGIKVLSNKELLKQVKGSSLSLEKVNSTFINNELGDNIDLRELGYGSKRLEGAFRQQAEYSFTIPKNRVVKRGAEFNLNFRYSKNLDFNRSLVTVYINEIPVGSKKLEMEKGDADSLVIKLPEDVTKSHFYNVKVAFDLELKDLQCILRPEENPWAYILDNTYFYLPFVTGSDLMFENYPSPFVEERSTKKLLFVLPDSIDSGYLSAASNIAAFIGRDTVNNKGDITVIQASEFGKEYEENNIVVIGTAVNNSLIKKLNNSLFIKYNNDYSAFLSNEKVALLNDYSRELTAIQFIKSPYASDKAIIVITAPKDENLLRATSFLWNSENINKLRGNATLIDREGILTNYNYTESIEKKPTTIDISADIKDLKSKLNSRTISFIVFFIIVLLIIAIFTFYMIKKYRK